MIKWTQQFVIGEMATKYLGRGGWKNYSDIDIKKLYREMVRQGASIIEMGAMAELFAEFKDCTVLTVCTRKIPK